MSDHAYYELANEIACADKMKIKKKREYSSVYLSILRVTSAEGRSVSLIKTVKSGTVKRKQGELRDERTDGHKPIAFLVSRFSVVYEGGKTGTSQWCLSFNALKNLHDSTQASCLNLHLVLRTRGVQKTIS